MTELQDHAATILAGMHQQNQWTSSLWSGNQVNWMRRALVQAQAMMELAASANVSEGGREIAARVLGGMYGGTEPGGWPNFAGHYNDWARYALSQAQGLLTVTGDGQG